MLRLPLIPQGPFPRSGFCTCTQTLRPPDRTWWSDSSRNVSKPRDVTAHELNRWANRDAGDDDTEPGKDDDGYERDTMKVALRMLTARSVQRLIMQLQETDIRLATWLSDFCSKNSPMEGDLFLQKLLKAEPTTLVDTVTKRDKEVVPSELADRLMIVRHGMAKYLASSLPKYTSGCNLEVYRKHVESGIAIEKPKYRRK